MSSAAVLRRRGATSPSSPCWNEPEAAIEDLAKLHPGRKWNRPLLILVDEAQNLRPREIRTLAALHENTANLPLVAVLAGLSTTRDNLRRFHDPNDHLSSISRFNRGAILSLDRLDEKSVESAILHLHRGVGVEVAPEWVVRDAIALTQGWPAHLHNFIESYAERLIDADGDPARVDPKPVTAAFLERRFEYYQSRLDRVVRANRLATVVVISAVPSTGMSEASVGILAAAALERIEAPTTQRPIDSDVLVQHLIHCGVLAHARYNETLRCPLPSFRDHILAPRPEDAPAARILRGIREAFPHLFRAGLPETDSPLGPPGPTSESLRSSGWV